VRLQGGKTEFEGTVEVYLNGIWGIICGSHWDNNDATVICRQLALGEKGTAKHIPFSGLGPIPVYWSEVRCRGDEENILLCEKDIWQDGTCPQNMAAAVTCSSSLGKKKSRPRVLTPVRLAGGSDAHEGRVEVYHAGQWGTVCDDQWDDADAEVVCRQLGLGGVAKAWSQAHFGEGSGPVLLDEVRCTGNELSIEQCPKSSWREHNCGHKEDAGVSCTPLAVARQGNSDKGRAHSSGKRILRLRGNKAFWQYQDEAAVGWRNGALRLTGGRGSHEGHLEVYYAGQWGTVCDDGWTELNTQVVCRQLGFKYGKSAPARYSGGSSGPIWLDDVSCSGKETNLLQCSRREWGKHDCNHQEDVRLICHPDNDSHKPSLGKASPGNFFPGPPIRLMDGENKKEGRVEVFINGQWGTICDDGWSDKDAAVVCRQLGYRGPARARTMAYFGEGKGPIHVDNVKCTGHERSLADCIKQDIGTHNCRHSEDAGVIC
ncbi:Neurotrypsin, partial [Apaloderma vittatum]